MLVCKHAPTLTMCTKDYVTLNYCWEEKIFYPSVYRTAYSFRNGPVAHVSSGNKNSATKYHRNSAWGSYKQSLKFSFDHIHNVYDDDFYDVDIVVFNNNHQEKTIIACGYKDWEYYATRQEKRCWKRTKRLRHQWEKRVNRRSKHGSI